MKNLLNGKPLTFGDREQIKEIRRLNEIWMGLKPVAQIEDDHKLEFDKETGEWIEEYRGEYVVFDCIRQDCRFTNSITPLVECGYFVEYQVLNCLRCGEKYAVDEDEGNLYHKP